MHTRSSRKQAPKFGWLAILALGVILGGLFFGRNKTVPTTPTTASTSSSSSISTSSVSSFSEADADEATSSQEIDQVETGESETTSQISTAPVSTNLNVNQVLAGDFSSLVGTWTDSSGRSLTFDAAGLSQSNGSLSDYTAYADGIVQAYITFTDGYGATIYFIGKGTEFQLRSTPDDGFKYIDASDTSQDRILIGQSKTASSDPANFYYKQ